jgi:hypothetical protein
MKTSILRITARAGTRNNIDDGNHAPNWRLFLTGAVAAFGFVLAGCAESDHQSAVERKTVNGLPTVSMTETWRTQSKVDAIDYECRSLALTGTDGKTQIFTASPAVRNFNQIKKGDAVKVEYFTRVAASVRKITEEPKTPFVDVVLPAPPGQKPGILCLRKAQIEARVEEINYDTREVKLKSMTGDIMTLIADKKLQDLKTVRAGDLVVFDCTESLTIMVE